MAAPHLVAHQGAGEHVDGHDVMRMIGRVLREHLPLLPFDDPYRGSLMALLHVSGVAATPVREVK